MHCALSCKDNSECGTNGKCSVTYGPGNSFCVYPPTSPVGMIQLVYGTTCPTGWKEKSELRGQVIAGAPAPAAGGTTNKQPALGANETGRVGPHGHSATATITDPGHTHTNTLTDPGHGHDVIDPGHTHYTGGTPSGSGPQQRYISAGYSSPTVNKNNFPVATSQTGLTIKSSPSGVTLTNAATPTGVTASVTVQPQAGAYYPLAYVIACVRV